jgi:hypothetical protein
MKVGEILDHADPFLKENIMGGTFFSTDGAVRFCDHVSNGVIGRIIVSYGLNPFLYQPLTGFSSGIGSFCPKFPGFYRTLERPIRS